MRNLRSRAAALLLTALLAAGCSAEHPLASPPASDEQSNGNRSPSSAGPQAASALDLEALLVAEKARIAERQETEKAIYDSLKDRWQEVLDDTTGRYADSLVCDPKQYVATTKIVGPQGDDINFGEHTLRIPAGALTVPTVITAEAPTSLRVLAVFSPHGTQFRAGRSPTLELSYKHCRGPLDRAARIAYISSTGTILEWPPSQDFPELGLVRGLIAHFSNYIVAY